MEIHGCYYNVYAHHTPYIALLVSLCLDLVQGSTPEDMPSWMANIQKKLLDTRTHLNVQLFLTRLITHRPKVCPISHACKCLQCCLLQVFQPYAKFWLPCLIDLILKWRHSVEGLQYFVVDVVVTLLSWGSTAMPDVRM